MLPSSKDIPAAGILDIGRDRVATILWTIRRGWKRARAGAGIEPGTPEVKLNVCLRDGMVEALKSQGGNRRTPRMQVSMGNETLSDPSVGVPDGRVDIAVSFFAIIEARHDHDPHAIIECKAHRGDRFPSLPRVCQGGDRPLRHRQVRWPPCGRLHGWLPGIGHRCSRRAGDQPILGPQWTACRAPWSGRRRSCGLEQPSPEAGRHRATRFAPRLPGVRVARSAQLPSRSDPV